jgi:hypothetical protein
MAEGIIAKQGSGLASSSTKSPGPAKAKVETAYMVDQSAHGNVVTGSAAVLDDRFSARFIIGEVQIDDGRLKISEFGGGSREMVLRPELTKPFAGMKPAPHTILSPWSPLSPCYKFDRDTFYDVVALDDGRLCMVLPGEPHNFPVTSEQGRIWSVTPFPREGVLAAISQPILERKGTSVALDNKHNVEGIDIQTHKVIWSFPSKNDALDVGRLTWINARFLLWACFARHWCAFEVYDVSRQTVVARGSQTDRDEGNYRVQNWRVSGGKVLEYYWQTRKPKVVFEARK